MQDRGYLGGSVGDNGKENGNCYSIGCRDNGTENYCLEIMGVI